LHARNLNLFRYTIGTERKESEKKLVHRESQSRKCYHAITVDRKTRACACARITNSRIDIGTKTFKSPAIFLGEINSPVATSEFSRSHRSAPRYVDRIGGGGGRSRVHVHVIYAAMRFIRCVLRYNSVRKHLVHGMKDYDVYISM